MEVKKVKKKSNLTPFVAIGVVGVIVLFVGGLFVTIGHWTPAPHQWKYSNSDDYNAAYHGWKELTETESLIGYLLMDMGMLIIMLMGFLAPFSRNIVQEDKKFFLALGVASTFIFVVLTTGLF
jgi:hypothetical protein